MLKTDYAHDHPTENEIARAFALIHSFPRFVIRPGLDRMRTILDQLDHPESSLSFVHVAGTNGKGSTCSFIAAMLEEAGQRVGLYTSPYLATFNDRMSINGVEISDEELVAAVDAIRPLVEQLENGPFGSPSEFEVVTLIALVWFARQNVDIVVWETGLGGRLDTTNVITPLVSVITNVEYDHQEQLGHTIEAIAGEKAGIIKEGVPVVTGAEGAALRVILARASELGSESVVHGRDFRYTREQWGWGGQRFNWWGGTGDLIGLSTGMLGAHQCANASVAIAAVDLLRAKGHFDICNRAIRRGVDRMRWAGRLEVICREPLILLDGAHNEHGAKALGAALEELVPGRRIIAVVGVLADKVVEEVLRPVLRFADLMVATAPDNPRASTPGELAQFARSLGFAKVREAVNVEQAMKLALSLVEAAEDMILCMGSLYTISEVREAMLRDQGDKVAVN